MDEDRGVPWRTIREIRALLEVLGSEVTAQRIDAEVLEVQVHGLEH